MRIFLVTGVCIFMCAWMLAGCGPRGAATGSALQAGTPDSGLPAANPEPAQRNVLQVAMPALSRLAPGAEFEYVLSANMSDALYQGSGRVLYDSRVLRPTAAQWGALAPAHGVCVAKLDTPPDASGGAGLDCAVPFAFTALPGQGAAAPGQGVLLSLRFKLIGVPHGAEVLRLLNDPAYLQLRDAQGKRLSFDISEEVSAK
jgi:hypothetical protein